MRIERTGTTWGPTLTTFSNCISIFPKAFSRTVLMQIADFRAMILGPGRFYLPSQCFRKQTQRNWFDLAKFDQVKIAVAKRMMAVALDSYNAVFRFKRLAGE